MEDTRADPIPIAEDGAEAPLDISLGPAQIVDPLPCHFPSRRPDLHTARVGRPDRQEPRTFLALEAWTALLAHAAEGGDCEVSGLLLGTPCVFGAEQFLDITAALPALDATGSQHSVTIDHQAWQSLLAAKELCAPSARIVGWYHSHPAIGIFLSERDKFVHTHFFSRPWQVALVVDPMAQRWGLFGWEEGALATRGGCYLYGPSGERSKIEESASVASRTVIIRKR